MQHSAEIDLYGGKIRNTVDELVGCLEGLDSDTLDWSPLDDANSLYVLATHTMNNLRHNILNVLCGLPVTREREAGSGAEIEARWSELEGQIADAIEELPPTEIDRERDHPHRGRITGRELLIVVARQAAEHYGQAQLTRDLVLAQRSDQ